MSVHINFADALKRIIDESGYQLSNMEPAEWAEANVKITRGRFQGMLSYDNAPYCREIINRLSPYDYHTEICIMGSAQWGKTASIIEPAIGHRIEQFPTQIGYLAGHSELAHEAMERVDTLIQNCGIGRLIFSQSLKKRNKKSGDTDKKKEFPGGSLISGSADNHSLLRQRDYGFIVIDDIDAAKQSSAKDGDTVSLVRARGGSYGDGKKILWVSTPSTKTQSVIEPLFLSMDRNYWYIPCYHCGVCIHLDFFAKAKNGDAAGMVWKDTKGILVPNSVEYICQECGNPIKQSKNYESIRHGNWVPTATSEDPRHCSFHMNRFYSMAGMNSWEDMAREYLKANPVGGKRDNEKHKTFLNLTLGLTYEEVQETPEATSIMRNIRKYEPGIIPSRLSEQDGNGKIVMLTCGADLNGLIKGVNSSEYDDGRLDWEIVGHSENGATYSIDKGSIGTFFRGERHTSNNRQRWTYRPAKEYNIFTEFKKVLTKKWLRDDGVTSMRLAGVGIDFGYGQEYVLKFLAEINRDLLFPIGLKGDKDSDEETLDKLTGNTDDFYESTVGRNLYMVRVNKIKDRVSRYMKIDWDRSNNQPPNFMNFPQSVSGKYQLDDFYSHFESEHRTQIKRKNGSLYYGWEKRNSNVNNHFWDCRIYNEVVKDIIVKLYCSKISKRVLNPTWADFVTLATKND